MSNYVSWTLIDTPAENNYTSITYGLYNSSPTFIAVSSSGTGNRVLKSTNNGSTWQTKPSANDYSWSSVTFGNNTFVAVANSGTGNRVMTSSDGGETWTARTTPADNSWMSVTYGLYNGTHTFIAVSNTGTQNRIMRSTNNGVTWSLVTTPVAADSLNFHSIAYGNGHFIAVGGNGTSNAMISANGGLTWTFGTTPSGSSWWGITYVNGSTFVAVGTSVPRFMISYNNGSTWTLIVPPLNPLNSFTNIWKAITYGNNMYVSVSIYSSSGQLQLGSNSTAVTSSNGTNWTISTTPADNNWQAVTFGNGVFVAISFPPNSPTALTGQTANKRVMVGTIVQQAQTIRSHHINFISPILFI
jgi:hypothetical protein